MTWFYANNRERKGPVSEEEFRGLVTQGEIKHDTLVWNEEMANWEPYAKVQAESVAASAPPPLKKEVVAEPAAQCAPASEESVKSMSGGIICAGCNEPFHFESVTRVGDVYSCHFCRPKLELDLEEAHLNADYVPPEEILGSDYESSLGSCVGRGLEVWTHGFFALVFATVVVYLIRFMCGSIPFIGGLINMILHGAIMGGYWMCFIRRLRGEDPQGALFSGFGPRFVDLIIVTVLCSILPTLFLVPGVMFAVAGGLMQNGGVQLFGIVTLLIGGMLSIYLLIGWMFSIPLAADKGLKFWPAMQLSRQMVSKQFGANLFLVIAVGVFLVVPQFVVAAKAYPILQEKLNGVSPQELLGNLDQTMMEVFTPLAPYILTTIAWSTFYMPFFMSCLAVRYDDIFGNLQEE